MRKLYAFVLFFSFAGSAGVVYASCGAASCPFDTRSSFMSEKGLVRVGYDFEYIDQDQPRIGTTKASIGQIPGDHDEQRTISRTHRMYGTVGVTDRLSLDLALPVISRSHRHIDNESGSPEPQGWDFTGVGDLMVQGRYDFYKPAEMNRPTLSGIAGVEFPTGKSDIVNDDGDAAEPGITPGSDSYDFVVGGVALQNFNVPTLTGEHGMLPLFLSVTYKINGKGREDYRLGNLLTTNLGTSYPIMKAVSVVSQLNLVVKEQDDRGETDEQVERTGGDYLYYSPGITLRLGASWEWSTIVQIPIYQRVNVIQLTSSYNLLSGISYKFRI